MSNLDDLIASLVVGLYLSVLIISSMWAVANQTV